MIPKALAHRLMVITALAGLVGCSHTAPEMAPAQAPAADFQAAPTADIMMEAEPTAKCAPGEGDGIGGTGCDLE